MPPFIMHTLEFISKYKFFGIIPLNMTLHFLISTIISIILLKNDVKPKRVFLYIFLLGILKEIFDSFALGNTMTKHIRDMCINLTYPTLIIIIDSIKKKYQPSNAGTSPIKSNLEK